MDRRDAGPVADVESPTCASRPTTRASIRVTVPPPRPVAGPTSLPRQRRAQALAQVQQGQQGRHVRPGRKVGQQGADTGLVAVTDRPHDVLDRLPGPGIDACRTGRGPTRPACPADSPRPAPAEAPDTPVMPSPTDRAAARSLPPGACLGAQRVQPPALNPWLPLGRLRGATPSQAQCSCVPGTRTPGRPHRRAAHTRAPRGRRTRSRAGPPRTCLRRRPAPGPARTTPPRARPPRLCPLRHPDIPEHRHLRGPGHGQPLHTHPHRPVPRFGRASASSSLAQSDRRSVPCASSARCSTGSSTRTVQIGPAWPQAGWRGRGTTCRAWRNEPLRRLTGSRCGEAVTGVCGQQ